MKGLILKDLITTKKNLKVVIAIIVFLYSILVCIQGKYYIHDFNYSYNVYIFI